MRLDLLRFRYALATGNDCGPLPRLTIHALTPVMRAIQAQPDADILAPVGQPTGTAAEIIEATRCLRDEIAAIGRALAEKLGFDYPAAAEEAVWRGWQRVEDEPEKG